MECIKVKMEEVTNVVHELISCQREAMVYCVQEDSWAILGNNSEKEMCNAKRLGVNFVQVNHEGGTMITSPGDVDVGIFTNGYYGNFLRDEIIRQIMEKAHKYGYEAVLVGNDMLVDGKKVIGFGSRVFGKILYTAIQISVNLNEELIEKVCEKESHKIPGGLKQYGIDTSDIVDILSKVFDTNLEA